MVKTEKIPEGYRATEAGILPVDWQAKRLSEVATELTERAGQDKYETVSISAGIGFVNQAEKFGKELSGKQYEKYIVLHQGDFSYNKGNSKTSPQGCIYRLNDRETAAVPNVFESFRIEGQNADYYEQLFLSGFLNKQLYSKINRGVRDDGLLNLTGKDFYSCIVPVPPIAEQKKIAEILAQCDKVIELKKRNIAEMTTEKEGLLNSVFPKIGFNLPTTRFPQFSEPWKTKKIGELTQVLSASRVHKEEWKNEGVPFFRSSDVVAAFKGEENKKAFISPELFEKLASVSGKPEQGDLFITGGGSVGMPYIVPNNNPLYSKDADLIWIKRCKELNPYFVFTYFTSPEYKKYLSSIAHTGTISHYTIEQVKATPIMFPTIEEQNKIEQLFKHIDTLIRNCQKELAEAITMKCALSQLLLTGIVRVKP